MHVLGSLATSGNANQGSFMDVLLTGNHDLLIRPQAALDLDLISDQIANLNASCEHTLTRRVVHVNHGDTAKIAHHSDSWNREHIDHGGIVDARFADHPG